MADDIQQEWPKPPSAYEETPFIPSVSGLEETVQFLWLRGVALPRLSRNVCREVASYFSIDLLVKLDRDRLHLFQVSTRTWTRARFFSQPIDCDLGTTYAIVDAATVFCCGNMKLSGKGKPAQVAANAYTLRLTAEIVEVQKIPRMRDLRGSPGAICYQGLAYVFGGSCHTGSSHYEGTAVYLRSAEDADSEDHSTLRTSEYIRLEEGREWTLLPRMQHARGEFTPLLYCGRIYLPGGPVHPCIEVFDPSALSFSTLPVDDSPSQVAWIAGHCLVLISKVAVKKIDLRDPSLPPAALKYSSYTLPSTARSPTAAVHGCLYFIGNDNCVHQLQIVRDELTDTNDFTRAIEGCAKVWDISHMTTHQYDAVCRSWQRNKVLSRSIAWDAGSRFAKVDDDTLFVCGNCKAGIKQALLVRIGGGARAVVEDLPGLLLDRSCPGLIAYSETLFAFGGRC